MDKIYKLKIKIVDKKLTNLIPNNITEQAVIPIDNDDLVEYYNRLIMYYNFLFEQYPDVVKVKTLKRMLPKMGKNKIYKLLQDKEIYSKRIGRIYYIPKISVIEYLIKK